MAIIIFPLAFSSILATGLDLGKLPLFPRIGVADVNRPLLSSPLLSRRLASLPRWLASKAGQPVPAAAHGAGEGDAIK